ncbi:MAG: HlyC/CorC family transporter [Bacilli bacterium]|nr:HlyC/CorC family transporter [Bacilli bacterium]
MPIAVSIIIIVICILLCAFFAGSETAYNVVNKLRLKKDKENKNFSGSLAYDHVEDFGGTVSALLLGNNIFNIAATVVATLMFSELLKGKVSDDSITWITTGVMLLSVLVFGEILPKCLATSYNYGFSKVVALPVKIIKIIFFPVVWFLDKIVWLFNLPFRKKHEEDEETPSVTDDELMEMVDTIEEEGVIDKEQSELIKSAIDFTDITAYEVMTPRVDVFGFDIDSNISELTQDADIFTHSRIPVFKDSLDNIIGILNSIDLLKAMANGEVNIDIESLMKKPYFVPESQQVSSIMEDFRTSRHHMAIVVDEFGGTAGILTLEDIVEELVGDIWDEMDEIEEEYHEEEDGVYIVDGSMNVEDFFELVGLDPDEIETEVTTFSGWCNEKLERFAKKDDSFDFKNITVILLNV